MGKQSLLERVSAGVRTGRTEEFENFYILTVQEAFSAALRAAGGEKEKAGELLARAFVGLYENREEIPEDEEEIRRFVAEAVYREAGISAGAEEGEDTGDPAAVSGEERISENTAAELWMEVEERAGLSAEDELGDEAGQDGRGEHGAREYLKSFARVALMFAVLGALAFFLYRGVIRLEAGKGEAQTASENGDWAGENAGADGNGTDGMKNGERGVYGENGLDGEGPVKEGETLSEKETAGFVLEGDRLILLAENGLPFRGELSQGKQVLSFSDDGVLTGIEKNRRVDETGISAFDGQARYSVRNGDIYRREPGEDKEECVVRNGHVSWADFRCQKLFYVCSYQIPNSEQVKVTAYQADWDGENQMELMTDPAVLSNGGLQFTGSWVYYRRGNSVFRKSLTGDLKEKMATTEGEYFAFDDTLFYMDGEELLSVSEGDADYEESGGYLASLEGGRILFLTEDGEPAEGDENGELAIGDRVYTVKGGAVASVRQAEQIYNGGLYYLDGADGERKLYCKTLEGGSTALMPQNGLHTDSFCLSGKWLYYSACMENIDGLQYSQLYRIDLDNLAQEKVGRLFQGVITAMYRDENENRIFGEYISETINGRIHGNICAIMADGQMGIIEDSVPRSGGNDRLEFVAAQGDDIYCFYHECTYDSASGTIRDVSGKAVLVSW